MPYQRIAAALLDVVRDLFLDLFGDRALSRLRRDRAVTILLIVLATVVVVFLLAVGTSYLYAWYLEASR